MTTANHDIRCVQTGGTSGPIRQGILAEEAMILPAGGLAFFIDGCPVVGTLIPQQHRAEDLRQSHRETLAEAEAYDRAQGTRGDLA